MRIEKDFKEFIRLLNEKKVKYLIVGGFAFSFYAEPRYTKDIDFYIERSSDNAAKLIAVLTDFWQQPISLKVEEIIKPEQIIQFGHPPLRIDLITSIEGVEFGAAWKRRVEARYGDITAWFISLEDLIVNKKASGREQDLLDAKLLEKLKLRLTK